MKNVPEDSNGTKARNLNRRTIGAAGYTGRDRRKNVMSKIIRQAGVHRTLLLERRLHRRALLYWYSISGGRELIPVDEFDPLVLEDRSAHSFMLELSDTNGPVVCHIGPFLREEAAVTMAPVALADVPPQSLLGRFAGDWGEVLSQRRPIIAEYELTNADRYQVSCRGVLLPLSSDGEALDRVYGVISWKRENGPSAGDEERASTARFDGC